MINGWNTAIVLSTGGTTRRPEANERWCPRELLAAGVSGLDAWGFGAWV